MIFPQNFKYFPPLSSFFWQEGHYNSLFICKYGVFFLLDSRFFSVPLISYSLNMVCLGVVSWFFFFWRRMCSNFPSWCSLNFLDLWLNVWLILDSSQPLWLHIFLLFLLSSLSGISIKHMLHFCSCLIVLECTWIFSPFPFNMILTYFYSIDLFMLLTYLCSH